MRIAIYVRKSNYSEKSDSTKLQYEMGVEYCKKNYPGADVICFEDDGFSGSNTQRPSFTQMMEGVRNGMFNIVMCYKIDRISRSVNDFSKFFDTLTEYSVSFVSVKEQLDTSSPMGRAMMYFCSVFAQMEREVITERTADACLNLSQSGRWAGGKPPVGYRAVPVQSGGKTHKMLEINEEEAEYVRKIASDFMEKGCLNAVEAYYKKNKIRSINGNYMSSTQIWHILRNPIYCTADAAAYDYYKSLGCIMSSPREAFDGTHAIMSYGRTSGGKKKKHVANDQSQWRISVGLHKPIFDSKTFIKIQNMFSSNKIDKTRKIKCGMLRNVLTCKCGWKMRPKEKFDKQYNKIYRHYYCHRRSRYGTDECQMPFVRMEILDEMVISMLKKIAIDKNCIDEYIEKKEEKPDKNDAIRIKNQIKKKQKSIGNLVDAISKNPDSSSAKYLMDEIDNLDSEKKRLEYELLKLDINKKEYENFDKTKENLYLQIKDFVENFETLTIEEKTEFLGNTLKECMWDGEVLHVKL